jgi:hypothetical protein
MFNGGMSPDMPTRSSPRDKIRSITGEELGAGARFISAHPDKRLTIKAKAHSNCSFFMSILLLLQTLKALLHDLHVLLLLLRGEHLEDLIAQLETVHHALGCDRRDLLGHLLRLGLVERGGGDHLAYG